MSIPSGARAPRRACTGNRWQPAAALWRSDYKQAAALRGAQLLQGAAAIAPVFEWENPPDDLDVARDAGSRVGAQHVRVLQAARLRYERMYREAGGIPVRSRVVEFLAERGAPLIRGTYDDRTGWGLYRALGGLAALAGICAYDADLQGIAQRYFFQALPMAKASGGRGFGGYVIALLVNQALYRGSNRQVIQYADMEADSGPWAPVVAHPQELARRPDRGEKRAGRPPAARAAVPGGRQGPRRAQRNPGAYDSRGAGVIACSMVVIRPHSSRSASMIEYTWYLVITSAPAKRSAQVWPLSVFFSSVFLVA